MPPGAHGRPWLTLQTGHVSGDPGPCDTRQKPLLPVNQDRRLQRFVFLKPKVCVRGLQSRPRKLTAVPSVVETVLTLQPARSSSLGDEPLKSPPRSTSNTGSSESKQKQNTHWPKDTGSEQQQGYETSRPSLGKAGRVTTPARITQRFPENMGGFHCFQLATLP